VRQQLVPDGRTELFVNSGTDSSSVISRENVDFCYANNMFVHTTDIEVVRAYFKGFARVLKARCPGSISGDSIITPCFQFAARLIGKALISLSLPPYSSPRAGNPSIFRQQLRSARRAAHYRSVRFEFVELPQRPISAAAVFCVAIALGSEA
jgi:hypothetical protein